MKQGLRVVQSRDLAAEAERLLLPQLLTVLRNRGDGHCIRVSDFDFELTRRLCGHLRQQVPKANVVVLADSGATASTFEFAVSSTKLVELRNPHDDGRLRPPLLVFIPNDVRVAAEDSFGVATFEELTFPDLYEDLKNRLIEEVPDPFRGALAECVRRLQDPDKPWRFATPFAIVRFLLTGKLNDWDGDAFGAALFEVGLVPDFELLKHPENAPRRLNRNRACVARLTWSPKSDRGRVAELELKDRSFRAALGAHLAELGLEDPSVWTRRIVEDRRGWPFAFHHWRFDDDGAPSAIHIGSVVAELPVVKEDETDEKLRDLVGQKVLALGKGGVRKFSVSFTVHPAPDKVDGLARFALQVISKEDGPVGLVRNVKAWTGKRTTAKATFTGLKKPDWQNGWHFVRVVPLSDDGDLIPLLDSDGQPIPWSDQTDPEQGPNETDLFYVFKGGEWEIEPQQRSAKREPSLVHARTRLKFAALMDKSDDTPDDVSVTAVHWADQGTQRRSVRSERIEVHFGSLGRIDIPVSTPLKRIEQRILGDAEGPIAWRSRIAPDQAQTATGEALQWPTTSATREFLTARAAYFEAVEGGSAKLITQGADLFACRHLAQAYARAYEAMLRDLVSRAGQSTGDRRALADLQAMLRLDTVLLDVRDHKDRRREAVLVAPTHPLRALWHATWGSLCERWVEAAKEAPDEFQVPTRDALLQMLAPMSFPPVLAASNAKLLPAVENLHPFWTLYAPPQEANPRSLVGDVCAALGLEEPALGGTKIDGAYLADRVQRYLVQHPYVRTLVINAFNAGRAKLLAEMLLRLQKQPVFADIRYDIRLFVSDADAPGVGQAFDALLSPGGRLATREADAFSIPTESHLRPKLAVAVRSMDTFRRNADSHAAHISMLFDLFPAEEIGAARAPPAEAAAAIHGLAQDFLLQYSEAESNVMWSRQPQHGVATPLPGSEELTDLLSSLPELISSATATVATGETGIELRPVIRLSLKSDDKALLHQVHEHSDWVFTLDRNMGIEFFDHGGQRGRPDYLIDHSPDLAGSFGHRLTVTSRSIEELEAMLCPVLERYQLRAEGRHASAILDQLRSLSGRLALKLISAPTQRAEALGLALSRMYLEHQGVFANQVVVPLDAHLELYRKLKKTADELGDDVSFKRTDLALFDLDAGTRTITCRLVEVKCYTKVGDLTAFHDLKASIAIQIAQSEQVLSLHFDPHRAPVDRPDRLVKTRELVTLLEFYLDRAARYGAIDEIAAEEAKYLLRTLESGYRLQFTRSALIFDFDKPGTEPPDNEGGIEFHRIGIDLINELVDAAAPGSDDDTVEPASDEQPPAPAMPVAARSLAEIGRRRTRTPSLPAVTAAAFLSTARDRSVSWDDLRSKRVLGESIAPALDDPAEQGAEERRTPEDDVAPKPPARKGAAVVEQAPPKKSDTKSAPPTAHKPAVIEKPVAAAEKPVAAAENSAATPGDRIAATERPPEPKQRELVLPPAAQSDEGPHFDVMLGVSSKSPQYGVLGELGGRKIAIDLNHTHTISLFGVQGGGKSYTLGAIAEMASLPIPNVNHLPRPLATVIFHYSPTMDYKPEFTSMVSPNSDAAQVASLRERYGAEPRALDDVVLLVPEDKLAERRAEYPSINVHPLKFASRELQVSHWQFLMGAVGNNATYIRQLRRIMRQLRHNLTLDGIRQGVDASQMQDNIKTLAHERLDFASDYIDDDAELRSLIRPGRLVIVDVRDEWTTKDQALGLFVVLLQLFADAKHKGKAFNKLVVFDEAHKYIDSPDLVAGLVEVVREMRHKGTSIMVASQDPPSVPVSLIELSSQIILHKFNSPAWLKHIQKANAALSGLTADKMKTLRPGEAYVWSSKASDDAFCQGALKMRCRPRVTAHGGATKTAVDG